MSSAKSRPQCVKNFASGEHKAGQRDMEPGLILGLHPTNERRRYKVTPSLIGWTQT